MVHFEDIHKDGLLINTMNSSEQDCLIYNTININEEVNIINKYLKKDKSIHIIVYGKNYRDKNIIQKHNQLKKLGFQNVSIYFGGMFEWLMLQEIYGYEHFKTIGKTLDILKYK